MGVLDPRMTLTCYKVATTRNAAGDLIYGAETAMKCWFRDITDFVLGDNNRERIDADAMLWLPTDEAVANAVIKNDVIKFDDEFYRISRLTKAKRLAEAEIQFYKCELLKVRQTS